MARGFHRRRWRLDLDGPGRYRTKIADMLKDQLGIDVEAHEIHCNGSPSDRLLDMCRWCVDGKDANGRFVHVCSWSRMGDIIRCKVIGVVEDNPHHFEVSLGAPTPPKKQKSKKLIDIFRDD